MSTVKIAIDMMSGDGGLPATTQGCLLALKQCDHVEFVCCGIEDQIRAALDALKMSDALRARIHIHHCEQIVENDEQPVRALRDKKQSSMRIGIDMVKEGDVHACVSAGNTGALMAMSHLVLRTYPGIDRPAIMAAFPTDSTSKCTFVMDVGANVEATPHQLEQYAVMGTCALECLEISKPKVALLNIGEEDIKGNPLVKEAHVLLQANTYINYQGYLEPNHIFDGEADLMICDGFVGNSVLKAAEGASKLFGSSLRKAIKSDIRGWLAYPFFKPILKKLKEQLSPTSVNGATFLGLKGLVIKSHGGADAEAFASAIDKAVHYVDADLFNRLHEELADDSTDDTTTED